MRIKGYDAFRDEECVLDLKYFTSLESLTPVLEAEILKELKVLRGMLRVVTESTLEGAGILDILEEFYKVISLKDIQVLREENHG